MSKYLADLKVIQEIGRQVAEKMRAGTEKETVRKWAADEINQQTGGYTQSIPYTVENIIQSNACVANNGNDNLWWPAGSPFGIVYRWNK